MTRQLRVAVLSGLFLLPSLGMVNSVRAQNAPPEATDQEQFVSYWTTEGNWDSELQLRNNQKSRVLTVTPVLRTADGKETVLSAVTINPQEVKSFDINAALQTMAPQLMAAYGSVVLRYHSTDAQNLYAVLMLHDVGHPIVWHIDGRVEDSYQTASREGVWWLPTASTSDYLILTNYGQDPMAVDLSLYDAAGKEVKQAVNLGPAQTIRYSVRQLVQAGGLGGSYGGIKVFASAHADSLDTLHALFDEKAGFSAFLKMFDYDPNAKIEERDFARTGVWTLRAPMLALSHPDPALGFPEGTTLQPQILVRNTTPNPVNVALRFNWRGDGTTGKASGPALQLAPYETRRVDIGAMQDGKILPADARWSSVTLTSDGKPDEVMAVAASYDASLQFGAQTPFSDTLNFQWEGNAWEYDAHHNSIITAGNGGTKPTRAAFTMFYNQGAEKYELEQTLQPDEQMWIDVGSLIRNRTPDKNGKALPLDIGGGSYQFRDLTDHGVGSLFEGKVVYDTTYGQVTYGCAICCGYNATLLLTNPLGIPLQFTAGNGVESWDTCWGTWDDVSNSFYNNWSTANPSIAKVGSYGTHTGMAVGSTTSSTFGELAWYNQRCYMRNRTPQGADNVMMLNCPSSIARGGNASCSVTNAPTGATFSGWKFTDSNNNTVTSNNTGSSWSGTMVTGGTVSVLVSGQTTLSATITVNNRNWHTAPASPAEVANGTLITLPQPPQSTGNDAGLGYFKWQYVFNSGLQYSTINDNGPNQGYTYWPSNQIFSTWNFQYEINPDLENTGSTFYQAQCGNYNATTNPNGFISGSNLLTQTNRHEWNSSTQSHYAFYSNALGSSSNNPGDFLEQQIAVPGANLSTFATSSNSGLTSRLNTVSSDSQVEPYPVNDDSAGNLLGNINYAPYTACH